MGTRHMVGVVLDGDFKVAQYGQWDGYPSGVGADIVTFCKDVDYETFKDKLRSVRFCTDEDRKEIQERWNSIGAGEGGWVTMEQAREFNSEPKFYALSRDVSAGVLNMIMNDQVEFLSDDRDFPKDSLSCEWAYVIDLDRHMLEVYEGFQKTTPKKGRWAGNEGFSDGYMACTLIAEYRLDELPTVDEFVLQTDRDDDVEE